MGYNFLDWSAYALQRQLYEGIPEGLPGAGSCKSGSRCTWNWQTPFNLKSRKTTMNACTPEEETQVSTSVWSSRNRDARVIRNTLWRLSPQAMVHSTCRAQRILTTACIHQQTRRLTCWTMRTPWRRTNCRIVWLKKITWRMQQTHRWLCTTSNARRTPA